MNPRLAALRDFLARYGRVFKAAWSVRDALDPPQRSGDELAFLPAHLELTDTPVSPASRWIMRTIMAFFIVALLWACIGTLDIVAVAPGKTVPGSRTKVIQSMETAVVKRILVHDGQAVKKGQLLIELDATTTAADFAKAGDALVDAHLAEARYAAVAESLDTHSTPHLPPIPGVDETRRAQNESLAQSQYAAYAAQAGKLAAALSQRQAELATTAALIQPLQDSAKIATDRSADFKNLADKKYVARHEYLTREQERIAAQRDLITQQSRLQELRSAISGARNELQTFATTTRQQTLDGLRQAREQIDQLTPDVVKTGNRDRLMQLTAPVDGTVQQLIVHTVGGVVTPAQPLLSVVPTEAALEVEAMVLNKDIGFVRPGQAAIVKIESFPYTRYGYIDGTVLTVSHDAVQDDKLGLVFPARVRLKQASLRIEGVRINLTPGMSLSVEIRTGGRRVIDYLLSPLKQYGSESMRER